MKTLIFSSVIAVLASTAHAGDWTGGYVGGGVGNGDLDVSGPTQGGSGSTYGLHVGYDFDFGDWVVGGEFEYDWMDIGFAGGSMTLDNISRLKAKVGYDFGQVLGYVVVGGAKAFTTGLGDKSGSVYGLGLAYQVSPQFMLSGEVLRHDFDGFSNTQLGSIDLEVDTFNVRASFRF